MGRLTFGWKASQQHFSIERYRELWTVVDESGFDSCWVFDHLRPMGRDRTGDIFEAWTILAAMAQATRRVRLGTLVTGNGYRHPALLAKMASTVDHLSGGRLVVGLGAGGDPLADAMVGLPEVPARERVERLDEAARVLRLLWDEPVANFDGKHYRLSGAISDPEPVQRPLPLWLASNGERVGLRVVAERADGWLTATFDQEPGDLVRLMTALDRHCHAAGRDPETLRRGVQFPGDRQRRRHVAGSRAVRGGRFHRSRADAAGCRRRPSGGPAATAARGGLTVLRGRSAWWWSCSAPESAWAACGGR